MRPIPGRPINIEEIIVRHILDVSDLQHPLPVLHSPRRVQPVDHIVPGRLVAFSDIVVPLELQNIPLGVIIIAVKGTKEGFTKSLHHIVVSLEISVHIKAVDDTKAGTITHVRTETPEQLINNEGVSDVIFPRPNPKSLIATKSARRTIQRQIDRWISIIIAEVEIEGRLLNRLIRPGRSRCLTQLHPRAAKTTCRDPQPNICSKSDGTILKIILGVNRAFIRTTSINDVVVIKNARRLPSVVRIRAPVDCQRPEWVIKGPLGITCIHQGRACLHPCILINQKSMRLDIRGNIAVRKGSSSDHMPSPGIDRIQRKRQHVITTVCKRRFSAIGSITNQCPGRHRSERHCNRTIIKATLLTKVGSISLSYKPSPGIRILRTWRLKISPLSITGMAIAVVWKLPWILGCNLRNRISIRIIKP